MNEIYRNMLAAGLKTDSWENHKELLKPFVQKVLKSKYLAYKSNQVPSLIALGDTLGKLNFLLENNVDPGILQYENEDDFFLNPIYQLFTYSYLLKSQAEEYRQKLCLIISEHPHILKKFVSYKPFHNGKSFKTILQTVINQADFESLKFILNNNDELFNNIGFIKDCYQMICAKLNFKETNFKKQFINLVLEKNKFDMVKLEQFINHKTCYDSDASCTSIIKDINDLKIIHLIEEKKHCLKNKNHTISMMLVKNYINNKCKTDLLVMNIPQIAKDLSIIISKTQSLGFCSFEGQEVFLTWLDKFKNNNCLSNEKIEEFSLKIQTISEHNKINHAKML